MKKSAAASAGPDAPGTTVSGRSFLLPLNSLRFFAALIVLVFHCGQEALTEAPAFVRNFFQNGYQAVSFFFVLSGFILAYVYFDPASPNGIKGGWRKFWIARLSRLYPVYAVSLLIAAPAFVYSGFISELLPLPHLAQATITVPLMLQAWFPSLALSWNAPAWSISVEAAFYLSFPFVTWMLVKRASIPVTFAFGGLAAAVTLVRALLFARLGSDADSELARSFLNYFPLLHLPTFVFGAMLCGAVLSRRGPSPGLAELLLGVGLLLTILLFAGRHAAPGVGLADTPLLGIFAMIILGGAFATGQLARLLGCRVLVYLGDVSYALYILHLPLHFWWNRLGGQRIWTDAPLMNLCCFTLGACVLAAGIHTFVEAPLRKALSNWLMQLGQPRGVFGHQAG